MIDVLALHKRLKEIKEPIRVLLNAKNIDTLCNMHDFVLADAVISNVLALALLHDKEKELSNDSM